MQHARDTGQWRIRRSQPLRHVILLGLILLGPAACMTTNVEVDTTFPDPVIDTLPVHLGVYFDEGFGTYLLSDDVPQGGEWNVNIGAAQLLMFRRMLPAMFETVTELEAPDAPTEGVQAILVPQVDDMQFSIPLQTRTSAYEVWIKYDLTLYDTDGELIARWPLVAYGKNEDDGVMETGEAALQRAAINALRDAAAFLAIEFRTQDALADWLTAVLPADASPEPIGRTDAPTR